MASLDNRRHARAHAHACALAYARMHAQACAHDQARVHAQARAHVHAHGRGQGGSAEQQMIWSTSPTIQAGFASQLIPATVQVSMCPCTSYEASVHRTSFRACPGHLPAVFVFVFSCEETLLLALQCVKDRAFACQRMREPGRAALQAAAALHALP
eukprot:365555-Chlamydomonas_euryale.AAC.11